MSEAFSADVVCVVKQQKNSLKKLEKQSIKRSTTVKCKSHYLSNSIAKRPNFCFKKCSGVSN